MPVDFKTIMAQRFCCKVVKEKIKWFEMANRAILDIT
jgi:hypothetical protein